MTNWSKRTKVGLDFETSGVNVEADKIVTCAVVRDTPETEFEPHDVTAWTWLADPGIEIPTEASDIHGITTEHVREHGRPLAEVVPEILDRLLVELRPAEGDQWRPLIIYNAPYDLTIFDRECRRLGLLTLHETAEREGWCVVAFDPLVIDKARNKYVKGKGQRQLTPTCRRYGIELTDAHDALADVRASIELAGAIVAREPRLGNASAEQLLAWQRKWHGEQARNFAEYLGRIAGGKEGEERAELEAKAVGVRSEVGRWPLRPFPQPATV